MAAFESFPRATRREVRTCTLVTPPLPCVVPPGVFDAFCWCASDVLEWRSGASWDDATPIDGSDPARMVFVMRADMAEYLPRELAAVHAFGLGLTSEEALAPWAIDDATDELHAHGTRPGDAMWLAADNLNALFWGLHDWAHFHNHGPFEERAWTELQCDASALAWLWLNRASVPLCEAGWERVRREVLAVSTRRFEAEGRSLAALAPAALDASHLRAIFPRVTFHPKGATGFDGNDELISCVPWPAGPRKNPRNP